MTDDKNSLLDVLIIGGGPIGLACAIACEKTGLKYQVIERGCLVNSLYHYPLNMTFFSTPERLEIGGVPFISHNYKPTRSESLEYFRRVAMKWKLKVNVYEEVLNAEWQQGGYHIHSSKQNYSAANMIIATGFYDIPNPLHVPGEELAKVHHYYREAHPYFGQKIAVIGASNSGVDVALETFRKGAHVTMIVKHSSISDSVKYWVKPDIENRIREKEIACYFNSRVVAIRPHEIEVHTPDGLITLENDFVLAMTGYLPDFSLLERLGINIGEDEMKTPFYNPETMETNQQGIYLAGVICGGLKTNKWFIENSREHAVTIVADICRKQGNAYKIDLLNA